MSFILETIYELLIGAIFPEPKHGWLRGLLYLAPLLILVIAIGIAILLVR